jgi:hypothetical protein
VTKIPQYLLSLAGEYRVCSELNKRGIFATITYGNRKSVDVYAIGDRQRQALKIEVKTGQKKNFVTNITQKGLTDSPDAPDFWVLVHINHDGKGKFIERFFVLTHKEICEKQDAVNQKYLKGYLARHGREFNMSDGVDEMAVTDVEQYEDQWSKIVDDQRLKGHDL